LYVAKNAPIIEHLSGGYRTINFKDYVTSVQVYGNTRIIEIDILVPKSFPYQTIAEIDAIRNEIDQEIGGNPTEKWVTISFTGTRKWMAKDYLLDEEEDE